MPGEVDYGLHLAAPFHPAQALLGDGASKKVEYLNFGLQPGPLAHLEQSHLSSGLYWAESGCTEADIELVPFYQFGAKFELMPSY